MSMEDHSFDINIDFDNEQPPTSNNNPHANTKSDVSSSSSKPPQQPTNLSTLDEPVWQTIWRDLSGILRKLRIVLIPTKSSDRNELREWDLWGPLLFCLSLAICMGVSAKNGQSGVVFGGVFTIVWLGSAIVTLNAQLLGGKISFFQSVCVLGYCIFPLMICSIGFIFLQYWPLRFFIVIAACVWSCFSSSALVSENVLEDKRLLSIYPVVLFYIFISYLVFVQ